MSGRRRLGSALAAATIGTVTALAVLRTGPAEEASSWHPEPGIPGLSMKDVREHEYLWSGIRDLEGLRRKGTIDVGEYRYKVIELSAAYLGLEGEEARVFAEAASEAARSVREAYLQMRRGDGGYAAFRSEMDAAERRVRAQLRREPRHELFAPGCGKWLRRLALGPRFGGAAALNRAPAGAPG